jgi:hypothetical protein
MLTGHVNPDQLARGVTAVTLCGLGILEIARPGCFGGIWMYFRGARAALSPDQRERLERVLEARTAAEGATVRYMRYAGAFTIAMGALALVPSVPYVTAYAATSLGLAVAMLLAYLQFRRATAKRVAPLVRRNAWASLPPLAIAPAAICTLGAAAFAVFPQFRVGAITAVVSALVLCWIAWRVAVAPALLLGNDPQLEYRVDEHVRCCRATGLIALGCAPPTVIVLLGYASLPGNDPIVNGITLLVLVAFAIAQAVSINPIRDRIRFA